MKAVQRYFSVIVVLSTLACSSSQRPSDYRAELTIEDGTLEAFKDVKILGIDVQAFDVDDGFDAKHFILDAYERAVPRQTLERRGDPLHVSVDYTTTCPSPQDSPRACPRIVSANAQVLDHMHTLATVGWFDFRGGNAAQAAERFAMVLAGLYYGNAKVGFPARAYAPNISLQRTAPCGLAAELGSLGPG